MPVEKDLRSSLFYKPIQGKGLGVFSEIRIAKYEIIEYCPVLIIPKNQVEIIHGTVLHDYYFLWDHERAAIALGYGSLYNHSFTPNAEYIMDYAQNRLIIQALSDIPAGQEITFNYNGDATAKEPLWFTPE